MALPIQLREPPPGLPGEETVKKVQKMVALKAAGRSFNESLKKHKGYRNPDLLQKLVSSFGVDQHGSAFDPAIFSPSLRREDHIASLQEQNEREQLKKMRERVNLTSTSEGLMSLKTEKAIEFQRGGGSSTVAGALLAAQQVLNAATRNIAAAQPSRRERR
jgi:hypothetical protein